MSVEYLHVIVEEVSMEMFLRGLLPRLLGGVPFDVYPFQCKDELLARLPDRLWGYSAWLPEGHRIVVVVDRDDDDCHALKQQLEQWAQDAGLFTRSNRQQGQFTLVNRIAIEELEAWYFGDWDAVRTAYPRVSPTVTRKERYRDPDGIAGGTWEAFERELQRAGYFRAGLRKVETAQSIAPHIDPARNNSHSFQVFCQAVAELARRA